MGRAIKKVANSADPRDWHYLKWWQVWANAMPPLKWRWSAVGSCPSTGLLNQGLLVPKLNLPFSSWTDDIRYFDFILVNIPGNPIPFMIKSFGITIEVFNPNATLPVDPDGVPYNWHMILQTYDAPFSYTSADLYALDPPHDLVIHSDLLDSFGNPNPDFPNGITGEPVLWNTPDTPFTQADVCQ